MVIGVIGGVGSGKSTVLDYLEKNYLACVIKADDVAKQIMEYKTEVFCKIADCFPEVICGQKIDAEKLAQIVFSDSSKRELLNSITHPGTIKAINQRIAGSKAELTVVEAALLLGTGIEHQCDELWYIYCNEATRIRRLMENRNYSMEKAKNIIKSQPSDEDYRKACTNVIDNSGSVEDMKEQIDRLLCILSCGF